MTTEDAGRKDAIRSIKHRRALMQHVLGFCVANAAMIVIWLATGGGYFWPGWILLATGLALLFDVLTFTRRHAGDISEEDIQREMQRQAAR